MGTIFPAPDLAFGAAWEQVPPAQGMPVSPPLTKPFRVSPAQLGRGLNGPSPPDHPAVERHPPRPLVGGKRVLPLASLRQDPEPLVRLVLGGQLKVGLGESNQTRGCDSHSRSSSFRRAHHFPRNGPPVRHASRRAAIRCGRGWKSPRHAEASILSFAVSGGAERHPAEHCGSFPKEINQAQP